MKVKATEKFKELDAANNWGWVGKDAYEKLEQGKTVDLEDSPKSGLQEVLKGGYVKEANTKSKE
tara:strand:- start:208 stop:399 length:192 start_codon:yes stop_codon:yes gene_type:complete